MILEGKYYDASNDGYSNDIQEIEKAFARLLKRDTAMHMIQQANMLKVNDLKKEIVELTRATTVVKNPEYNPLIHRIKLTINKAEFIEIHTMVQEWHKDQGTKTKQKILIKRIDDKYYGSRKGFTLSLLNKFIQDSEGAMVVMCDKE